jgi:hypothetical protein
MMIEAADITSLSRSRRSSSDAAELASKPGRIQRPCDQQDHRKDARRLAAGWKSIFDAAPDQRPQAEAGDFPGNGVLLKSRGKR